MLSLACKSVYAVTVCMLLLSFSFIVFSTVLPSNAGAKMQYYAESNDQPQNIGYVARSNALEPVQNASKSVEEYRLY